MIYEPGDFTFDVPKTSVLFFLDRGRFGTTPSIRSGDDQPMTGSFSAYLTHLVDTDDNTLPDLAIVFASASYVVDNMTSTIGSASDETTWTITWTLEGSDFGGADRTLTFPYCSVRTSISEGDPNVVNITFTSHALIPTYA